MKRLLALMLLGVLLVGASGQYKKLTGSETVYLTITDAGDTLRGMRVEGIAAGDIDDSSMYRDTVFGVNVTYWTPAKVVKMIPTTVMDSFKYVDSIYGARDAGNDSVIFLSTVYTGTVTPTFDTSKTYWFRVTWASGDTSGFDFDCGAAGETIDSVEILIDSLMDSIAAYTDFTDSITFHDSVTYIKMISKFSSETQGGTGRWSFHYDSGPQYGLLTFAGAATNATVAMICDSMVAKINAKTTVGDSLLATDYGSYYTISTKEGDSTNTLNLPGGWSVAARGIGAGFHVADSGHYDTVITAASIASVIDGMVAAVTAIEATVDSSIVAVDEDTAYYVLTRRGTDIAYGADDRFQMDDTTNDAEGVSSVTDSIYIGIVEGYETMFSKVKINAATGRTGLGTNDSVEVWLSTSTPAGNWVIANYDTVGIPYTLQTIVPKLKGDSTLGEQLYIKYNYYDTVSDTTMQVPFRIEWDVLLK